MWKTLCVLLAAFGALNWAALAMFDTDAVRALLGDERTIGTDAVRIVVAGASVAAIILVLKPEK